MNSLDWNQGYWGPEITDGNCIVWTEPGDVGNCAIAACNSRGDGGVSYMNSFNGPTSYGLIKQWCKPDNAGGTATPDYYATIKASNNPSYKPGRAAFRAVRGQVVSRVMTIEEFNAFEEKGKEVNGENLRARGTSLRKRVCDGLDCQPVDTRLRALQGPNLASLWFIQEHSQGRSALPHERRCQWWSNSAVVNS